MEHFTTCPRCGQPIWTGQISEQVPERERAPSPPAPQIEPQAEIVPHLTLHALLRYLERAWGVDVEAAKKEILTDTVISGIRAGAKVVTLWRQGRPYRMPVVDGRITTVLDNSVRPRKMLTPRGAAKPERDELREILREWAEEAMA